MGPQPAVDPLLPLEPPAVADALGGAAAGALAGAAVVEVDAAAGAVDDGVVAGAGVVEPLSDDAVAASVPVPDAASPVLGDLARWLSRKSFLAHPDPLNTMAGAVSALRIDPPHTAHAAGPLAEIEWITSTLVPQASQT